MSTKPLYEPSEKTIERASVKWLRIQGCKVVKLQLTRTRGMPDVLVLMPHESMWFIEFKTKKGALSVIQKHTISEIRELGFRVDVLRSVDDMQKIYRELVGAVIST